MAKNNIEDAGGIRRTSGTLPGSMKSMTSTAQKQGQGMNDNNSKQMGYNASALRRFKDNPGRSL